VIVCAPARPKTWLVRMVSRSDNCREGFRLSTGMVHYKDDEYYLVRGQWAEDDLADLMVHCLRRGISLELS
jgi:hypothetical protein